MMRRAWCFRVFASFLALWLPLVAGEAGLLQPCPVHGVHAAAAHGSTSHDAMHQASMHQMHAMQHDTAPSDDGPAPTHEHHGCSCLACCTMTLTATLADGAPAIEVPEPIARGDVSFPLRSLQVALTPAYSRPYTRGPPRA